MSDHHMRQFPVAPSLFLRRPRNSSWEVRVGEGREREREMEEEDGVVGEEDMAARSPSGR